MFAPEDCLMISGLQHFRFCCRQWALIHLEQQWAENLRTVEGEFLHERAHNEQLQERRGDLLTVRGLRVQSLTLGLSGICDVVEFRQDARGVPLSGKEGQWLPYPVEYKRGVPKQDGCDELQLCAQAMCLEEMLCCEIPEGALYYGEPRRRLRVSLTKELREEVCSDAAQMHALYRRGHTPRVRRTKSCNACSLKELCLPGLQKSGSVRDYLRRHMEDAP